MKKVLITGENSYIGTNVEKWLLESNETFIVKTVSTFDYKWKNENFSDYDTVLHVAGIAHVNAKKSMEPLYRKVNTDLTVEIATHAKKCGVKQFIFMSSMIVFKESRSLKETHITSQTQPSPNGFYGDSKLQAEKKLDLLKDQNFKVCIIRPPMVYGPGCKGNFLRLVKLCLKTPFFPKFHNARSMIYIDNLCELIKQLILNEKVGYFHPQNKELVDTVEIAKQFSLFDNHKIFIWKWLNIFVYIGSPFINAFNKMFASSYYDLTMSKYDFEYQIVDQQESFKAIYEDMK